MLPLAHRYGRSPSQIGFGVSPSLNTSTAPAICGVAPTNPADWWIWVVPVLPMVCLFQVALRAGPDAVPSTVSLLIAWARLRARPGSTACSQPGSLIATDLPSRSTTWSIGLGGHHRPSLTSVAPTLDSSSTLVTVTPSVNEPILP